jgi:hypothetical protein
MDLLGRGVDIRSVFTPEALAQPERFELITHLARIGEQARLLPACRRLRTAAIQT